MIVEDVMSINPISISPGEFVTKARELIRDNGIGSLPVVRNGRYEGMITVQDIISVTSTKSDVTIDGFIRRNVPTVTLATKVEEAAKKLLDTDEGRLPVVLEGSRLAGILSIVDLFGELEELGVPDLPVSEVMTKKVIVCEPGDPISRVWRNMTEFGIYGFPVVRASQEVIGMITREDVLRRGYVRFERESDKTRQSSIVQMIMTTPAITVPEDESVRKVATIFSSRGIGRLPVVKDKKLAGIVDRYDVLRVCRRLMAVE